MPLSLEVDDTIGGPSVEAMSASDTRFFAVTLNAGREPAELWTALNVGGGNMSWSTERWWLLLGRQGGELGIASLRLGEHDTPDEPLDVVLAKLVIELRPGEPGSVVSAVRSFADYDQWLQAAGTSPKSDYAEDVEYVSDDDSETTENMLLPGEPFGGMDETEAEDAFESRLLPRSPRPLPTLPPLPPGNLSPRGSMAEVDAAEAEARLLGDDAVSSSSSSSRSWVVVEDAVEDAAVEAPMSVDRPPSLLLSEDNYVSAPSPLGSIDNVLGLIDNLIGEEASSSSEEEEEAPTTRHVVIGEEEASSSEEEQGAQTSPAPWSDDESGAARREELLHRLVWEAAQEDELAEEQLAEEEQLAAAEEAELAEEALAAELSYLAKEAEQNDASALAAEERSAALEAEYSAALAQHQQKDDRDTAAAASEEERSAASEAEYAAALQKQQHGVIYSTDYVKEAAGVEYAAALAAHGLIYSSDYGQEEAEQSAALEAEYLNAHAAQELVYSSDYGDRDTAWASAGERSAALEAEYQAALQQHQLHGIYSDDYAKGEEAERSAALEAEFFREAQDYDASDRDTAWASADSQVKMAKIDQARRAFENYYGEAESEKQRSPTFLTQVDEDSEEPASYDASAYRHSAKLEPEEELWKRAWLSTGINVQTEKKETSSLTDKVASACLRKHGSTLLPSAPLVSKEATTPHNDHAPFAERYDKRLNRHVLRHELNVEGIYAQIDSRLKGNDRTLESILAKTRAKILL